MDTRVSCARLSAVVIVIPALDVIAPSTCRVDAISTAPSISTTSRLVVPSTSISPEISSAVPISVCVSVSCPFDAIVIASASEAEPIVPPSLINMSSLNVTIPADETVIASTVEATPIVPPSFMSMSSLNVTIPPDETVIASTADVTPIVPPSLKTISSATVSNPAELNVILDEAVSEAAVLNTSLVALLLELKSPSDTASIPAATNTASVPVPSSGAWKLIVPITSSAWISVSAVCNVKVVGELSEVFVLSMIRPELWSCLSNTSWSAPNFTSPPSARNKSENSNVAEPNVAPSLASGTNAVVAVNVVAWNVPFVVNPVSATWVMLISWSSPKLMTAPSARNKSLNSSDAEPNAAPSLASGRNAVVAVMFVPWTAPEPVIAPVTKSPSPTYKSSAIPAECAIKAPLVEFVASVFVEIVTTPAEDIAIAFVSLAEPILPSSGITILPPVVSNPPPVIVPLLTILLETVRTPAELKDIFSAAASDAPVWKLNFVALFEELKSPSDIAWIAAPTSIASVPVPSSGAWNCILPNTSLTAMSVSPVWRRRLGKESSAVVACFSMSPASALWVNVISLSLPKERTPLSFAIAILSWKSPPDLALTMSARVKTSFTITSISSLDANAARPAIVFAVFVL